MVIGALDNLVVTWSKQWLLFRLDRPVVIRVSSDFSYSGWGIGIQSWLGGGGVAIR